MAYQQEYGNPQKHRHSDYPAQVGVAKWKVTLQDVYNLSQLYKALHDWAVENGWADRDEREFPEVYYFDKDTPIGKEVHFWWRLEKAPENTKSKLFRYFMDLDFKLLGLKDAEIMYQGKKVKTKRSEFELECSGILVLDYDKTWSNSIFKNWWELFYKRSIARQFVMHKSVVFQDSMKFRDIIMDHFKLTTFMPEKEGGEYYLKRDFT
ncbi:hypothetical protein COV18_01150 [Candidatus Woesearchaeota archaeon CG10_big_fil_rev_8_21_14_0_10_37_12]|nr:MAG: hypothetical protein COV18_01150 [Candidatus Woesearchaeota archaeon CG10_big_fil_rev_8_21_14_0_10_37_12]